MTHSRSLPPRMCLPRASQPWTCRLVARTAALVLAALGLLLLAGCNQQGKPTSTTAAPKEAALTPATDPRVSAHLDTFGRTEALITSWDGLRADGRMQDARRVESQIRTEVDRQFPTFEQAAGGSMGLHAQYLSVSALGFSANPKATSILAQRLLEKDAKLQGNALISLGLRADPRTPVDALLNRTSPAMPLDVKRYAPLALAKVLEAQRAAGMPPNAGVAQNALARLGALAVDHDPIVRLHVIQALRAINSPAGYRYLAVLVGDPQMRVRWAAAGALDALGDPRGFPGVIRLLHDVAPDSKHIIRDILVSYGGRLQGRSLTAAEIDSLGTGPRAWTQWYTEWRRSRGIAPGQAIQPNGAISPGPARGTPRRPTPARGSLQPAPRPYTPSGATRGGG